GRSQPKTIVTSANLRHPSSLFYDVTSNRIYWVERSIIKSCTTNGLDIKGYVITGGATQAFAYKGFFGWINADKIYFKRKTSRIIEPTLDILQNASHVSIFDSSLQKDRRGGCHILNGGCEDICVPLGTGRKCECDIGLQLQSDLKTCDSSTYSTNFLLVSDYSHGRILQVDINTGNIVKLPIVVKTHPGMTFDKLGMKLIYSSLSSRTIMSTTLHGKNTSLLYATGFAHAESLTIDYSTGNIYYTAKSFTPSLSYIGVVHRAALLHRTLFSNLHSPGDIVVYPSKGFLYWTEFGNRPKIGRSYMDGTSKEYITTTDIGWPIGLAIDFISNKLYWTDGLKNRIEYSNLNGLNRHVLTTDNDAHLMSVVIHGEFLYYTAWNRQRITKINKATGSKVTFMKNHPELGRLDSLDIFTGDSVDVNRICSKNNGGCSTFCFPTPTGRTCGCQDYVDLEADQKTCQGVSRCDTSLQNVNFPDCLPYSGQTCPVACKSGYKLVSNTSVTCDQSGQWTPSPNPFCMASGCSKAIRNGQLINCQSNIQETCEYRCFSPLEINPSVPNITCKENGTWSDDTNNLCVHLCPSTIRNGKLAESCIRNIGNKCSYSCDINYRPSLSSPNIVCTSGSTWNENTDGLCKRRPFSFRFLCSKNYCSNNYLCYKYEMLRKVPI
ncbi:low-density lipoprotein receptor-related protein 4-like, partial [Saccostrea cucullata]|uniref:low-density lipoprotein receptor-related protein 4-like n=1 Tax=Saccostrea cuccullata TaxID=36930 RepID=UPI002ED3C1B1